MESYPTAHLADKEKLPVGDFKLPTPPASSCFTLGL
jgi:hypothetical protein